MVWITFPALSFIATGSGLAAGLALLIAAGLKHNGRRVPAGSIRTAADGKEDIP